MLKLKVSKRDTTQEPEELRNSGIIPAVFYGPKEASQSIQLLYPEFEKTFREAGESTVVVLDLDGQSIETLIHDVAYHPVKGTISHVDFYALEKGKKVQVNIPLEFVGIAPAEKNLGGAFMKVMHELEIEAMPAQLPQYINVNISTLIDFDSKIIASEIILPLGVELITSPDEVIALVQAPKDEVEEEVVPVDISTIEVEKKGKKEEEPAE